MARTIVFVNQKGGVGKTTSAINLGAYLALVGKRTLLVDFDPQANLTSGLGLKKEGGRGIVLDLSGLDLSRGEIAALVEIGRAHV
jgi:cellulose biosynthesis protein BcsQ